jgi:hypothetical protein
MNTLIWDPERIQKELVWRYPKKDKSTIPSNALGDFEIFNGGRGNPYHQSKKIYFFYILSTHQYEQIFIDRFFSNFSTFGR